MVISEKNLAKHVPACVLLNQKVIGEIMAKKNENFTWQDLPDAEERLAKLRDRDLEISRIALGLQMRTRITTLEQENAVLRSMRENWTQSRVSRLYFSLPRIIRSFIKKFSR